MQFKREVQSLNFKMIKEKNRLEIDYITKIRASSFECVFIVYFTDKFINY